MWVWNNEIIGIDNVTVFDDGMINQNLILENDNEEKPIFTDEELKDIHIYKEDINLGMARCSSYPLGFYDNVSFSGKRSLSGLLRIFAHILKVRKTEKKEMKLFLN